MMSVVENVMPDPVEGHIKLVCEHLNEKHRRWVAGLLSEVVGHGGTKWVSGITGLDPKTIRQGRLDLQQGLGGCPPERVRRVGGGRPPMEKKIARLNRT